MGEGKDRTLEGEEGDSLTCVYCFSLLADEAGTDWALAVTRAFTTLPDHYSSPFWYALESLHPLSLSTPFL